MPTLTGEWTAHLHVNAADYARVALTNIVREFPSDVRHLMAEPGDFPNRPRDRNPVFYGSFDWHSCVEMHWLLVRLLRTAAQHIPGAEIRTMLDEQFTADKIEAEARFMADPDSGARQRPYGWGWALALVHETTALVHETTALGKWTEELRPLADVVTQRFVEWLPRQEYPIRYGVHTNTAFGLSRALPHARDRAVNGDPALLEAITDAAHRWYGDDADYPGGWEPSGSDFLSPALVEAELMASLLTADRFETWLDAFLPGLAGHQPHELFTPVSVTDSSDGQIAHLHGLNASRAWCWRRLAALLPDGDPRRGPMTEAARRHADAALQHAVGEHYMVEHWLAAYAVLLLT